MDHVFSLYQLLVDIRREISIVPYHKRSPAEVLGLGWEGIMIQNPS